ncbi:SDR family NAD(P)-dependent oxidoreductase, partial [Mycobacterium sp. 1165178.9]|uniref:SDR family NAD(P)-dependent oxidoreductase n=1 Tax=Mycobacterium sp. 1165178.9 TaxID=1834070 RepID=UPI0012EA7AA6
MPSMNFDNQVAIVTGAGGGLGRCHALELARRGARVVVNDLGGAVDGTGASISAAQAVVDEITSAGGTAIANGDSVATEEGGAAIVAAAMDAYGQV